MLEGECKRVLETYELAGKTEADLRTFASASKTGKKAAHEFAKCLAMNAN